MLNLNINTNQAFYYRKAMNFYVYKIHHPVLKKCFKAIWLQVLEKYKAKAKRLRSLNKREHACMHILNNLFKAQYLTFNPWVGYSRDKNQYLKGRYRNRTRFKYESFVQTVDHLRDLGLITHKENIHFPGYSFSSRMKASKKLIKIFDSLDLVNLTSLYNQPKEQNQIILKDKSKKGIPYRTNDQITGWKNNLIIINKKINESRICLDMQDAQYHQLIMKLNKDKYRVDSFPDFTATTLHRVFNNSSFEQGGRFFGGWWQSIPRDFRKFITINYKPTEEVDYSGHHIRILYALEEKDLVGQPYEVDDSSRNTPDLIQNRKDATLIMLNSRNKVQAAHAIKNEGIKNIQRLMLEIEARHSEISHKFYTGVGNKLMNQDSMIAEEVMIEMIKLNHTILPVHDSFIVRNSATFELIPIMEKVFNKYCNSKTILKTKETMLEWNSEQEKQKRKNSNSKFNFANMDLSYLIEENFEKKTIVNKFWNP